MKYFDHDFIIIVFKTPSLSHLTANYIICFGLIWGKQASPRVLGSVDGVFHTRFHTINQLHQNGIHRVE